MSENLFEIPEQKLSVLDAARQRYLKAKESYDAAQAIEDDGGKLVPEAIRHEVRSASRALLCEEQREVDRRKA